ILVTCVHPYRYPRWKLFIFLDPFLVVTWLSSILCSVDHDKPLAALQNYLKSPTASANTAEKSVATTIHESDSVSKHS
ncbi:hypothetical protein STEG23_014961, partial [Scotinomys teguina]